MKAPQIDGDVAVVALGLPGARRAAIALGARMPAARLLPMTTAQYLRRSPPLPLVLAVEGEDPEADRRFLENARDRLLWPLPGGDLYDALSGILTSLPPRPRRRGGRRPEDADSTGLLLEGIVTAERARAALASPVRRWVVEHVGAVRLSAGELERLSNEGVAWSVLAPLRLVAVADPGRSARGVFPPGTAIWRGSSVSALGAVSARSPARPASRARSRRPSPR